MLISMRERQKKMMKKLSQVKLYSLLTIRYRHEPLFQLFSVLTFVYSASLFESLLSNSYPLQFCQVGKEVSIIFILRFSFLYCFQHALRRFLTTRRMIAAAKKQMNTIIQVNWLEKKLAVLQRSLYFPKIFWPSVLLIKSVVSITKREPEVMASNVNELMLNRYKFVRKMSNCCGKYKLMNTIIDISCTSSIVLIKKCRCPVRSPLKTVKNRARLKNTAMMDLLLQLNQLFTVHVPVISSSVSFVQQHIPAMGLNAPDVPRFVGHYKHWQYYEPKQVLQVQWQEVVWVSTYDKSKRHTRRQASPLLLILLLQSPTYIQQFCIIRFQYHFFWLPSAQDNVASFWGVSGF